MWWTHYKAGEKPLDVGYVTDYKQLARERTAGRLGGVLIDTPVPDGYCIVADGTNIIAARTGDSNTIATFPDPLPGIDDWRDVYQLMLDRGLIGGFDYFNRCDNDYLKRWPAIKSALDAIEEDIKHNGR